MTDFPDLKFKALISFPASILDGAGIDVVKDGATYQFNIAFDDFAPPITNIPPIDAPNLNALLWNNVTGTYVLAPITAFVASAPGTSLPLMDGVAAVGTSVLYSREDHRHPSDTSRASVTYVDAQDAAVIAHADAGDAALQASKADKTYVDAQDALRAPINNPVLTGDPKAPTPAPGDNDTSIATTAFVTSTVGTAITAANVPAPATAAPLMDGVAAVGVATKYAREDHKHPTDTSLAPINNPIFTGDPRAPTPAPGDNDTSIATTAFVTAAVVAGGSTSPSNANPIMDGVAAPGASALYSRGDHVHPSDTSRAPLASPVFTGDPQAPTPAAGDIDTSIATTAFVNGAVIAAANDYLFGLTMSTVGASATMTIGAGSACDSTGARIMKLAAPLAKTTAAWVAGAGGGLDTGAISASTFYHFFLIMNVGSGAVDVVFSKTATPAAGPTTMPPGFTLFRRIGSMKTNASSQWLLFIQDGDLFSLDVPAADINQTNPGTAAVARSLTVPPGLRTKARVMLGFISSNIADMPGGILLSDLGLSDQAPSVVLSSFGVFIGSGTLGNFQLEGTTEVMANASSQIRSRLQFSGASTQILITTLGWTDTRGRI